MSRAYQPPHRPGMGWRTYLGGAAARRPLRDITPMPTLEQLDAAERRARWHDNREALRTYILTQKEDT